jgi:hypothetical protein
MKKAILELYLKQEKNLSSLSQTMKDFVLMENSNSMKVPLKILAYELRLGKE